MASSGQIAHLRLDEIPLMKQRLCIIKMLLTILHNLESMYMPGRGLAASSTEIVIMLAVLSGHYEGRPYSASKLAKFVGMPRATLMRRLVELERANVIVRRGRVYIANVDILVTDTPIGLTRRTVKAVQSAARFLSKLDT
jgi:hypothetical protein